MDVKTYRARTMQEALSLVRRELGPDAAVLHTRELCGSPFLRWIPGLKQVEVMASAEVAVPSRVASLERHEDAYAESMRHGVAVATSVATREAAPKSAFQTEVKGQLSELSAMVEDLCRRAHQAGHHDLPEQLFQLYTELIDADISQDLARELVGRVRASAPAAELGDPMLLKSRLSRMVEEDIQVAGPIEVTPGRRRIVALVGPTGVGKTTTIAKLAANFRLREKRRVGLITVDTYRIAAVEQLRTYADIIDLPMEVVSSHREMREAVDRMSGLDLVLMDTAGRSPADEIKIQELKAFLAAACADEVHLVLSSVTSAGTLERTARQFAAVGVTALILTKLDEAGALGNLLPLVQTSGLPLSYLTDGQSVPDDIAAADRRRLAEMILGVKI